MEFTLSFMVPEHEGHEHMTYGFFLPYFDSCRGGYTLQDFVGIQPFLDPSRIVLVLDFHFRFC